MPRGATSPLIALVVAGLLAACTTNGEEAAPPGVTGDADATDPAADGTAPAPATTAPPVTPTSTPSTPPPAAPTDTGPTAGAAPETSSPGDGSPEAAPTEADPAGTDAIATGEPVDDATAPGLAEQIAAEDFEPVFEIGPPVLLDVDVARFPVDDAGQGGGGRPDPGTLDGSGAATGWAAFNASLESALLRPGNTSAAVAVMIGGDLVNAAAFGVRDPARGDPAEPTDRFRIASISKPITAIAALELVEQGLIGLDEPVGRLLAEHVGADRLAPGAERLTLRRLLNHTTGYGKYYNTFFQRGADDCPDAARQGLGAGGGGGGYSYSNMNYCLAGLVVEAVTGEPLDRATYRLVLTPLGLSGMRLAPTVDPGPDEAQHRTTPGRAYMETLAGAGSWVASPIDLVTILDSLDISTPGFKPLEPGTVFAMLTPAGGTIGERGYGLGLISYGDGRFGHTGTIESTHAMVLNRGDGVIWAVTVAGDWPAESERLEQLVDAAFAAGGFVAG